MALVSKHAHDFRGERLVEKANNGLAIRPIARGDRALLDMFASPLGTWIPFALIFAAVTAPSLRCTVPTLFRARCDAA